jgi:hypothetical protein
MTNETADSYLYPEVEPFRTGRLRRQGAAPIPRGGGFCAGPFG